MNAVIQLTPYPQAGHYRATRAQSRFRHIFLSHRFLSCFHYLDRNTQHSGGRNRLSQLTYCRSVSDHTVANSSFIYLSKYQLWWSGRKNVCFAVSLLVLLHYSSRASLDIRTGVCADLKACLCPCWWTSAKSGREKWLIWRAICLSNVFLPVWKTNNNGKITFLGRMRFDATNMCPSFFNFSKQSHFQFFSLCGTSRNWSLLNVPSFLDCFSFGRLRIHWGSVLSCFLPLISEAVNHKCQR